jgi:hypothetical protein
MDHVHSHGHRMRHYRLPGNAVEDGRPTVSGIVVAVIRQKPVGWKSLGSHFLVFLNAAGVRVGEIDNSMDYGSRGAGTWEFNSEELRALCAATGLTFGIEVFATPDDFVAKHPEWTPPEFEFETEHRSTERVREWGLAVLLGIPIAVGFLVTGLYFVLVGPVGWIVAGLELLGIAVVMVLTAWGHSRWRMRRSLGRRSGTQARQQRSSRTATSSGPARSTASRPSPSTRS